MQEKHIRCVLSSIGTLLLMLAALDARAQQSCIETNGWSGPYLQWQQPCGTPFDNNCTQIKVSPRYMVNVQLDHCTGRFFGGFGTNDGPGMTNGLITVVTTVTTYTCSWTNPVGPVCIDPNTVVNTTNNSVPAALRYYTCDCNG